MKTTYLIILSLLVASLFLGITSANATESIVFVDDDPTNADSRTFYVGNWTQSTFYPQTYGQGYHFTRDQGSLTMRALLDIDESGGGVNGTSGSQFQAFARWSAGNNRCNAVRIEVRNATTNTTITSEVVNQTTQGLQFNWTPIGGRFTATPNHLYEIRFISPGLCVTTADGGMFVQQTYDSSDVFNLNNSSIIDEPGVDFNSDTGPITITSTSVTSPTLIASRTISCPGSGTRYVAATGSAWFNIYSGSNSTDNISSVRTSLSSTGSWDLTTEGWEGLRQNITSFPTLIGRGTISKTHVFTCSGGLSLPIFFYAVRSGAGSFTSAFDVSLVLTVFPTRY